MDVLVKRGNAGAHELVPRIVRGEVEALPIGKARALYGLMRKVKAQGPYQMQARSRKHARTADVACVGGNLWFYEHYVEHGLLSWFLGWSRIRISISY
jgi:hypothetical protein